MTPSITKSSTRQKIIAVAATMIHQRGFQGTSIGDLLNQLAVSKGALYHHFPSKQALGYAVFDEIYAPGFLDEWHTVFSANDPLEAMERLFEGFREKLTLDMLIHGCPINNLAQEMSSLDEGFKQRISRIMTEWRTRLGHALASAKKHGTLAEDIDAMRTASLIVAATQGSIGLAKSAQDLAFFHELLEGMINMLRRLRPLTPSQAKNP